MGGWRSCVELKDEVHRPPDSTRFDALLCEVERVETPGLCSLCSWGSGTWERGGSECFPDSFLGPLKLPVSIFQAGSLSKPGAYHLT